MNTPSPTTSTSGIPSWANSILKGKNMTAIEKAGAAMLVGQTIFAAWRKFKEVSHARNTTTLRFREGSEEYHWLCRWLAKQPRLDASQRSREFSPRHLAAAGMDPPCVSSLTKSEIEPDNRNEWALVPDTLQGVKFEDMVIGISRDSTGGKDSREYSRAVILTCTTRNLKSVDRLLEAIYMAGHDSSKQVPQVYTMTPWGDWHQSRALPLNRLPVLPFGVLDNLRADAKWFVGNESWYQSVGVPYRRGYLFHGVPGSGKTTTATALASAMERDIYILSLDGVSDDRMSSAIRSVGRSGILLIEDIDCATAALSRDSQPNQDAGTRERPTLQGLLNSIDGVATPEGRITIATTNRIEALDKALIRPGRFDCLFKFGFADTYQIEELCHRFGIHAEATKIGDSWHAEQISMAEVQRRLIERCGICPNEPILSTDSN